MRINMEEKEGITIFKLSGNIDIDTSPEIKKNIDKSIASVKDKIIINLQEVAYIDSSGLATLIEILKELRARGAKLKLASLSRKVKGLFEITRLDQLFDIRPNEEEAISSFK